MRLIDYQQARALIPRHHENGTTPEEEDSTIAMQSHPTIGPQGRFEEERVTLTFRMNRLSAKAIEYVQRTSRGETAFSEAAVVIDEATALDADHANSILRGPISISSQGYGSSLNGAYPASHHNTVLPALQNLYRAARVVLHEVRLRCATDLNSQGARNRVPGGRTYDMCVWESASTVRVVAEDIRNSIPYILGDTDGKTFVGSDLLRPGIMAGAYLLLWPLLVMRLATCTTKEQREVASSTLERIGTQFGIKQAHELLRSHKSLFEG